MEPIRIFVISRDAEVLAQVISFFAEKEFEADGVSENEQALLEFVKKPYDMVVIGGGIDNASRDLFKKQFVLTNPEVEFIEHYCHPAELLTEIKEAFGD